MVRFDLIISYWIFFWYLLYIFKITTYSPKLALIVALVGNMIILLLMIIYNTSKKLILTYFIMVCLLKVIPLYTIWNSKIIEKDIILTGLIFLIHIIWLFINKKDTIKLINNYKNLILYSKNSMPGMMLLLEKFKF